MNGPEFDDLPIVVLKINVEAKSKREFDAGGQRKTVVVCCYIPPEDSCAVAMMKAALIFDRTLSYTAHSADCDDHTATQRRTVAPTTPDGTVTITASSNLFPTGFNDRISS